MEALQGKHRCHLNFLTLCNTWQGSIHVPAGKKAKYFSEIAVS
jgi:hypothetical protein